MSFLDKISAFLPTRERQEKREYFFALDISFEELQVALWVIEGKQLKIEAIAKESYGSLDEIPQVCDKLLDAVVGLREIEPQKILFGVPNSWILDENIKDEYLKVLRTLVKELELVPMAYVAAGNALIHFLEKKEGVPATAILAGFEKHHLVIGVVRAGKLDGVKTIKRGESAGSDIEKGLLQFADVETLPSKILIYGEGVKELKPQLLSFTWMSKLSFLHFPKIDVLEDDVEIKSICLAGASEINSSVVYSEKTEEKHIEQVKVMEEEDSEEELSKQKPGEKKGDIKKEDVEAEEDLGFMVGDISQKLEKEDTAEGEEPVAESQEETEEMPAEESDNLLPAEKDFRDTADMEEQELPVPESVGAAEPKKKFNIGNFLPHKIKKRILVPALFAVFAVLFGAYLFLAKADVKVFVEPKVLEKEAQVAADPEQKNVLENEKIIPGQIVETEVSGSAKDAATGRRQIGDPAKGTVIIYNKTSSGQTLSRGTEFSGGGLKFTLDNSITIASQSASDSGISFGKATVKITASAIGADGNLPSGSNFTVAGHSSDKLTAKAEGNFSGGTSKDVSVVSSDDAKRLLAKLSSDLRQQAQQKLSEKYPAKKILKEALAENIVKKSYNKNVNDPAQEFTLTMTIRFKGTAFDDADLKMIISKLVTTDVPEGFTLDLSGTETQAEVASLEKNGKLIFSTKFKAKLMPKINTEQIAGKIKFKTVKDAVEIIKGMENILGAEIKIKPKLPSFLGRLPVLSKNIRLEVGLK